MFEKRRKIAKQWKKIFFMLLMLLSQILFLFFRRLTFQTMLSTFRIHKSFIQLLKIELRAKVTRLAVGTCEDSWQFIFYVNKLSLNLCLKNFNLIDEFFFYWFSDFRTFFMCAQKCTKAIKSFQIFSFFGVLEVKCVFNGIS